MSNIFEEYAVLIAEIEALELKKSQLKPFIIKKMIEDGVKSMETPVGRFTVKTLKSWSYPKEIEELECEVKEQVKEIQEVVKAQKAKAESTGAATFETSESLIFTGIKL